MQRDIYREESTTARTPSGWSSGPSIVTTLVTRNINDWEVARFQQPEVAAHLLSAAGNEVKLDIDRCGDSVDIVDINRYLLTLRWSS